MARLWKWLRAKCFTNKIDERPDNGVLELFEMESVAKFVHKKLMFNNGIFHNSLRSDATQI